MTGKLHSRRNAAVATLVCLLVTMWFAPAGAHAKVYFSAFLATGGTGIERAGLQGGGLETLQTELSGYEDGLALDTAAGKMYFTDTAASVISSANLDGADTQIVLDDFGQEPLGIALDLANQKMYWTDRLGVKRANLNGGEEELLLAGHARGFIALDLAARKMYWADWPSGTINAAAMARGGTVTEIVSKQPAPFGIAVDPVGGKVYWLELNLGNRKRERDAIRRANLAGGEIQTLIERPGAGFEGGLAIEPATGKLYWTEAAGHDVGVANLDGSQPRTLLSTGEDSPEGLAVETVESHPQVAAAPYIEGSPQVGSPLGCNAGTWTGIGPLSFAYQWAIVGGASMEGATGSAYVPSSEQAGASLVCVVSAADNVASSSATSAAVNITPFSAASNPSAAGGLPAPTVSETPLIAGIAISSMTVSGTTARVPVFTTLAVAATLTARPGRASSRRAASAGRARPRRAGSPSVVRAGRQALIGLAGRRENNARTVTVHDKLAVGRSTITLRRLIPGMTYRLNLMIAARTAR
jgi:DNA-binding beta-propeller fold protein YncE